MTSRPLTVFLLVSGACAASSPEYFSTPQAATLKLIETLRAEDTERLEAILGPTGSDLIDSGDAVADRNSRAQFVAAYDEHHRLEPGPDGSHTLLVGELEWPLPIPIVSSEHGWWWDAAAGHEEMLNRRIGRNELNAIQVCLAIGDAQFEYASRDRDDDDILEYARHLASSDGQRDGLYWPTDEEEEPSPLGALAARAASENYRRANDGDAPNPYHGYHYRILTGQGEHATGGTYDYLVADSMLGGFAVLAYPATYGISGVMSFLMNHDGVVLQKDLGDETAALADQMTLFDPDPSWQPVQE